MTAAPSTPLVEDSTVTISPGWAPMPLAATTETVELTISSLQPPPHLEQSWPQADCRLTDTSARPPGRMRVTFAV